MSDLDNSLSMQNGLPERITCVATCGLQQESDALSLSRDYASLIANIVPVLLSTLRLLGNCGIRNIQKKCCRLPRILETSDSSCPAPTSSLNGGQKEFAEW